MRDRSGHLRAVPLEGAVIGGGRVWTAYPRKQVGQGPHLPEHGVLGPRTERDLCVLFGLPLPPQTARASWERRATVSRAVRDPTRPGVIQWLPGPRASGAPRGPDVPPDRTGATPTAAPAPPALPGGLPDRRRAGRPAPDAPRR